MRMRKLGKGQTIAFYALYETDMCIRKEYKVAANKKITNKHVIAYIMKNSRKFEQENMTHWTVAAFNYTKKLAVHRMEAAIDNVQASLEELANKCVDSESVDLKQIYGADDDVFLCDIAEAKFDELLKVYETSNVRDFITDMSTDVQTKIVEIAPYLRRFMHSLDDQQEKALEHEAEQERQLERPDAASTPKLSEKLSKFLQSGDASLLKRPDFVQMSDALLKTRLFEEYVDSRAKTWPDHLYVTRDFIEVIESSEKKDEYLPKHRQKIKRF